MPAISVRFLVVLLFGLTIVPETRADSTGHQAPYAGQDRLSLKALSPEDVSELMAGRGWGFAKPAELNGYPGPAHVLELRDEIGLTRAQQEKVQALFERMQLNARKIGADFIAAERQLDLAFAQKTVNPVALARLVEEAERLRAALRLVHLETHLETLPLLTPEQTARYATLRGYSAPDSRPDHRHHRH